MQFGSANPDPISDQTVNFVVPILRPGIYSCRIHTRFQAKMVKIYTLFWSKMAHKPYSLVPPYLQYIAYIEEFPRVNSCRLTVLPLGFQMPWDRLMPDLQVCPRKMPANAQGESGKIGTVKSKSKETAHWQIVGREKLKPNGNLNRTELPD